MGRDQYSHEDEKVIDEFAGQEISDIYLTKSEYQKLFDFIRTIKKVNIGTERDIYEIINDEIFAFFAGEKTSKEVAENIQNRVELLINEKI
jgi:ABC-type glycerol-3-phosphate transport system substrate-binding protein